MKRTVKLVATMLLATTVIFATSCGGNTSKKQSEETATETATAPVELRIKDTNKDNWQAVIKSNFGVDVPVPDGWTVTKAAEGLHSDVAVTFNIGGSTTGEQYGQMLFDATKAASQNGNHKVNLTTNGTEEGAAVSTLAEAITIAGETAYNWCFTETSEHHYTRQIHYSFSTDGKQALLSF